MGKSVRLTHERRREQDSLARDRSPAPAARELAEEEFSRPVAGGLAFPVQRKVVVGSAHDPAEVEAERVASALVASLRAADSADEVQRSTAHECAAGCGCAGVSVQRMVRGTIGLDGGEVGHDTERELRASVGGGIGIEPVLRRRLEGALGADLSAVRLHAGEQAGRLNRDMSAEAFTHGRDIYFRDGLPDTSTEAGLHLLGHELTHTVQQGTTPVRRMSKKGAKKGETIGTLTQLNAMIKQFNIKGGSVTLEDLDDAKGPAVDAAIAASTLQIDSSTTRNSVLGEIRTRMQNAKPAKSKSALEVRKEAAKACLVSDGEYYGGAANQPHVHVYGANFHLKMPERYDIVKNGQLVVSNLRDARGALKSAPAKAHLHAAIDKALLERGFELDTY